MDALRRIALSVLAPAAVLAAASLSSLACVPRAEPARPKLVVAAPALEQSALLYVAEERGLFVANGLDVTIRDTVSGVPALDAVESRTVDLGEAAEYPVVARALKGRALRVVASIDRFQNDYVVARKDRGITRPSDLEGRRIGLAKGTITELYLGRFLLRNHVEIDDVRLVDIAPAELGAALASGTVDAVIGWQPYVDGMLVAGGSRVVAWDAQAYQPAYAVLVADAAWLPEHEAGLEAFLRALTQAAEFTAAEPAQAQSIVARRLGYDGGYLRRVWPEHTFDVSLDFSLVAAMEEEARFLGGARTPQGTGAPDMGAYLYTKALRAVSPGAVGVGP